LWAIGLAAQVVAAVSAILLARRQAKHVPAAVALALLAGVNVLHAPVRATLTPDRIEPWEGTKRLIVYLDGAISLADYAIVAGLAVVVAVYPERRRLAVALVATVWLAASVVLAALYPSPLVRGFGLQRIYFAADLIGLFVSTGALITWIQRARAAKQSPSLVHFVAVGMVTSDALILLAPYSPWRGALFDAPYTAPQVVILVFFAVVIALQVNAWKNPLWFLVSICALLFVALVLLLVLVAVGK
jgi:hypothetical protein